MKNYREPVKRIMLQSEYLLSLKATAIYVIAIIIGIIFSLASIYRAYPIMSAFGFIAGILLVILLITIAGSMIDEINEGQAQLYLATGLSRSEYVVSWYIVSIVYPVLAVFLAIVLPVLIIDPPALLIRLSPYSSTLVPTLLTFAFAISLQLLNNISLGLMFGLMTKKKGIAYLTVVFIAFILPVALGIIVSMLGAMTGSYDAYHSIYLILVPFDPLFSYMIFSQGPIRLSDTAILLPPLVTTIISIVLMLHHAKNKLEV